MITGRARRLPDRGLPTPLLARRTIIVIGLTLNARHLPHSCTECNQHLRMMALAQRVR